MSRAAAVIAVWLTLATAATAGDLSPPPGGWSFRNHVLPVLTRAGCNAGACHGAAAGKGGLKLTLRGYAPELDHDVLTRQASGRRVDRNMPARSLMLLKASGALDHGGGLRLLEGSDDYRIVAEWIGAGAPGPRGDDPQLVALNPLPRTRSLPIGARESLRIEASYSDGRVEDVTRWAKFASTDDNVVRVDENGRFTVSGSGEAHISVWFNNLVELVTITSPYPDRTPPAVFARAPRHNKIDELNLAKLESLRIPPSPDAGDAAFLRRVYLDTTGTLPPVDIARAFLADEDPRKRQRLIDRLLDSPEYVDYWTYRWSDLLLVSSRSLPAPAMWSFSRWVRRAVAENWPWDRVAKELLTAKGSTLQNGAGNYFVLHRDPIDLTESTSVTFLGLSLTCARCHNHPLEKWTQDQYYGLASLFSRVSLKDGPRAGEVFVTPAATGELLHPRRGIAMAPQTLDGPALDPHARDDRRAAFADWLADPANPYFDRALVTRVWKNFFGRGLIDPEDDLRATNPPSDRVLMDWLVADFRAHGRDLKHLMRTILQSAVYARSSAPVPGNAADFTFLSHAVPRRLPAEVLFDAMATVTDVRSPFPGYPAGWRSLQLPDANVANLFLDSFGRPERAASCSCERSSEPSLAQALHLSNGNTLNEALRSESGAVSRAIASRQSDDAIIEALFLDALTRRPTDAERARLTAALAACPPGDAPARREAMEDLFWAVLTSPEFLFNH